MNEQKKNRPLIYGLAAAAALTLALALFMLLAPGAPRYSGGNEAQTQLTVYEGPATMKSSPTATISANGTPLFVYDVMVNHEHIWNANTQPTDTPMAYFDF